MKTGNWYYLNKLEFLAMILTIHYQLVKLLLRACWTQDFHVTFGIDRSKPVHGTTLDPTTGIMQTGWQHLGNKWYYLRSSGAMATGWYQEGSTWYYLHASNGDMKTGWFQVNGKWYYAYSSGALAVNTTVDGYYVNYNGEWVQ